MIKFTASIPTAATAIRFHGEGGARLILDIPANQEADFLPILAMRETALEVTLQPKPDIHAIS